MIYLFLLLSAGVAQLVEQLICNQQVGGSSPSTSSSFLTSSKTDSQFNMGEFPSGQRGQTVNLLRNRFDGSNPSSPTKLEEYHRKVGALLIFG